MMNDELNTAVMGVLVASSFIIHNS